MNDDSATRPIAVVRRSPGAALGPNRPPAGDPGVRTRRGPLPTRLHTASAGQRQSVIARVIDGAGDGAVLLRVVGVRESLLDLVPTERSRYISLGALLVGTASVGTISMWVALRQVSDAGWALAVALLLPALLWGLFVLIMDRALITSASGSSWWTRVPALLVRFALAGVLGLVIAEPLVLELFGTAIEQEINDGRDQEADDLRDRLDRCNPVPGTSTEASAEAAPLDCRGYLLDVPGLSVGGAADQLAALRSDEADLQDQVEAQAAERSRLDDVARRECVGEGGDGLSGVPGVGSLCRQARTVADEYADAHPPGPLTTRLERIRDQITQLGGSVAANGDAYTIEKERVIDERVQELVGNQGPIGLLERFASLDRLTSSQPSLLLREWLIRLVLVLIDCLPVLVKFLGGATAYDKIVDRELRSGQEVHKNLSDVGEHAIVSRLRADQQIRSDRVDADIRRSRADVLAEEDREIDERRHRYLNNAGRRDGQRIPPQQNGAPHGRGHHPDPGHGSGGSADPSHGHVGVERGEEPMGARSRTR